MRSKIEVLTFAHQKRVTFVLVVHTYVLTDWCLDGSLLGDLEGEDGVAARRLGVHVGTAHCSGQSSLLQTRQGLGGRDSDHGTVTLHKE